VSSESTAPGRQGILPFVIELAEDEQVTARAGLPLVIEALRAIRLDEEITSRLQVRSRRRGFDEVEKLEALVLLIAAGGDRIEDIRILSEDRGLLRLLDRRLPSPDALLAFLAAFDDSEAWATRPVDEASFVPVENAPLRALDEILRTSAGRIADPQATRATIDHDATIIESHKRDAQLAYDGTRGYQPIVSVWAEESLVVADEFRDGNVPAGKDPLASIRRAFEALPATVTQRYFRGDSADYHEEVLKYLVAEHISFAIGADMSEQLRNACLALAPTAWTLLEERVSETVEVAEVAFSPGNWPKDAKPLRYIARRFTPRQTELFSSRPVRHLAVVSNRDDLPAADLVHWYDGKAGTIEQVHRVFKDELGAGVLPSQRFGANAAWFRINALTYNLLTLLRRRALPNRLRDARPKRLRFEIFTLPGRLVAHQRRLSARVSAGEKRTAELIAARRCLIAMRAPPAAKTPSA